MRSELKWIAAGSALLAAAGCAPVDPGFGEALRYDMAIQTVDPEPVYPGGWGKAGRQRRTCGQGDGALSQGPDQAGCA